MKTRYTHRTVETLPGTTFETLTGRCMPEGEAVILARGPLRCPCLLCLGLQLRWHGRATKPQVVSALVMDFATGTAECPEADENSLPSPEKQRSAACLTTYCSSLLLILGWYSGQQGRVWMTSLVSTYFEGFFGGGVCFLSLLGLLVAVLRSWLRSG